MLKLIKVSFGFLDSLNPADLKKKMQSRTDRLQQHVLKIMPWRKLFEGNLSSVWKFAWICCTDSDRSWSKLWFWLSPNNKKHPELWVRHTSVYWFQKEKCSHYCWLQLALLYFISSHHSTRRPGPLVLLCSALCPANLTRWNSLTLPIFLVTCLQQMLGAKSWLSFLYCRRAEKGRGNPELIYLWFQHFA